jgi:anti-anti-sigma factor
VPTTDFQVHDGLLVVQQTSEGERFRIALSGEIDLANTETAASTLREALGSGKSVLVDLAKLEFLDSTAIAMLVAAIREGGEQLSFLPSDHAPVRRLLSLTGLDERMNLVPVAPVTPSLEESAEDPDAESLMPAGLTRPDLTRQPHRLRSTAAPGIAVPREHGAGIDLGEGVE